MASTTSSAIAPASVTVSGSDWAWDAAEGSVSPIAAPAAARMPVSRTATPTATSQPKKAAPQLIPPYSSRWRAPERSASSLRWRCRRPRSARGLPLPLAHDGVARDAVVGGTVVGGRRRGSAVSVRSCTALEALEHVLSPRLVAPQWWHPGVPPRARQANAAESERRFLAYFPGEPMNTK